MVARVRDGLLVARSVVGSLVRTPAVVGAGTAARKATVVGAVVRVGVRVRNGAVDRDRAALNREPVEHDGVVGGATGDLTGERDVARLRDRHVRRERPLFAKPDTELARRPLGDGDGNGDRGDRLAIDEAARGRGHAHGGAGRRLGVLALDDRERPAQRGGLLGVRRAVEVGHDVGVGVVAGADAILGIPGKGRAVDREAAEALTLHLVEGAVDEDELSSVVALFLVLVAGEQGCRGLRSPRLDSGRRRSGTETDGGDSERERCGEARDGAGLRTFRLTTAGHAKHGCPNVGCDHTGVG